MTSTTATKLVAYSIALNEEAHVNRWVESLLGAGFDRHDIILVDTGSTDDTIKLAESAGIIVHRIGVNPWRFDLARNAALALLPDDADLCLSIDLDECAQPGFVDAVRSAWEDGPFTKGRPWLDTGQAWRSDRVHARYGYRWVGPCHEVTVSYGITEVAVDLDATLVHHPDNTKTRGSYLALLEMAVAESPADARMWVYLARERMFQGGDILSPACQALSLNPWLPEAAAVCRWVATTDLNPRWWLERGIREGPLEAEAWHALAKYHHDLAQWDECLAAALAGLDCPPAFHYLADREARAWGLLDYAALAAHHLGRDTWAVDYGYQAWKASPGDGRLLTNLGFYAGALSADVHAIIPTAPEDSNPAGLRYLMTQQLADTLTAQGVKVFVDSTDAPIHAKWNRGLKRARDASAVCLVLNNDIEVGDGFVAAMVSASRIAPVVCVGEDVSGWCFAVSPDSPEPGAEIDEQFEFWYGDRDLFDRASAIEQCPIPVTHLHPTESTFSRPELLAAAVRDEARYVAKWGADPETLYLRRKGYVNA